MSTATHPPRCPHRVANTRPNCWLIFLIASLLGSTTATVSLYGQEVNFRFVEPAGHMQPWPVDEPEFVIFPTETLRIATKWRTNLTSPRKTEPTEDESAEAEPSEGEPSNDGNQLPDPKVEVLVVPKESDGKGSKKKGTKKQASSQTHECYQAPPLSTLTANILLPTGKQPQSAAEKCAAQTAPTGDARLDGAWASTELHWSATCSRHRPLYFEEINAERYGYTPSYALQPLISAAHFFGTIPALPYKMAVDCPNDCIYTLGHYRPGSCAPRRANYLPWQPKAGLAQAGAIAGLILLVP